MTRPTLLIVGIALLAMSGNTMGDDAVSNCTASCVEASKKKYGNSGSYEAQCRRFCKEALAEASEKTTGLHLRNALDEVQAQCRS